MDFIGGIEGMKFTPVSNYNDFLKANTSFDVDSSMDFENVLNKQTAALQNSMQVQGGVEMNNFEDIMAQTSVQGMEGASSTAHFAKSFSNSLNNGLSSVDGAVKASNKAQEAFAAGENISVHDVMIASEKASLSLGLAMQLRNKLLNIYSEINNIKV
jgi:flagellar hook-basal body complex protein FliE